VHSYFAHLFIQFDDHCSEPAWQGVSAITCHLIYCVQPDKDSVDLELLFDYLVISSD